MTDPSGRGRGPASRGSRSVRPMSDGRGQPLSLPTGEPQDAVPVRSLAARYAPGEDVAPLVGAVSGALLGVLILLAVDGLIPSAAPGRLVWRALAAEVLGGQSPAPTTLAVGCGVAVGAAIVFVYGRFRRFVPGPPWLAGVCWGALMWLAVAPLLLPLSVDWAALGGAPRPAASVLASAGLVFETALGLLFYGGTIGALNPPARSDPAIAPPGEPEEGN